VVNDVVTWTDGDPIPARVIGTATSMISDENGTVLPIAVWSDPATIGKYDIIVDVNGNGIYDEGIDALDNNDVEVSAGFMIPEYTSFVAILLLNAVALFLLKVYRRKHLI
jgi:hypothetical protein